MNTTYTRLILVRHGETIANRSFRYIGSSDEPLSERGVTQAQQLAEALAVLPVRAVYSSPLQRAYRTAVPIAERHGLEVQRLDGLREMSFGTWEGLTRAEVLTRSGEDARQLQAWERNAAIAPPGGESFVGMQLRVRETVERLVQEHPDSTIVLVSHVGPIKVLLSEAMGAPLASAFRIFLDPATISVVDWRDRDRATVRLVNSHAHLGWSSARWM
ncbi:MAG TPA: histidine phosphatase family protein [Ktedonobacteraceae bacterium]|nr:histidine phosphatase family protein [Ktedonobacteraceae bacterium]